jgi:hypothetical protein
MSGVQEYEQQLMKKSREKEDRTKRRRQRERQRKAGQGEDDNMSGGSYERDCELDDDEMDIYDNQFSQRETYKRRLRNNTEERKDEPRKRLRRAVVDSEEEKAKGPMEDESDYYISDSEQTTRSEKTCAFCQQQGYDLEGPYKKKHMFIDNDGNSQFF